MVLILLREVLCIYYVYLCDRKGIEEGFVREEKECFI